MRLRCWSGRRPAVHPHMRGDNSTVSGTLSSACGSPPHAWGQSMQPLQMPRLNRFTPTCVGTIPAPRPHCTHTTVHPHMRGDNCQVVRHKRRHVRFTPTCVGTICPTCGTEGQIPVHPHMRGDNDNPASPGSPAAGSPPHAWGQLIDELMTITRTRFTPTCVGTITTTPFSKATGAVHPHMRGDNSPCSNRACRAAGSPPHAWGQSGHMFMNISAKRFTPTCVGTICT